MLILDDGLNLKVGIKHIILDKMSKHNISDLLIYDADMLIKLLFGNVREYCWKQLEELCYQLLATCISRFRYKVKALSYKK